MIRDSYYDAEKGDKAVEWIEKYCTHVKGALGARSTWPLPRELPFERHPEIAARVAVDAVDVVDGALVRKPVHDLVHRVDGTRVSYSHHAKSGSSTSPLPTPSALM